MGKSYKKYSKILMENSEVLYYIFVAFSVYGLTIKCLLSNFWPDAMNYQIFFARFKLIFSKNGNI